MSIIVAAAKFDLNIYLSKFCTLFLLTNVYKRSTDSLKPFLLITQDLNKINKIPDTHLFILVSKRRV